MNNMIEIFSVENITFTTLIFMLTVSFFGGVVASISPCSIAMLPLMIGYVGGCSKETPYRTFLQLLSFILGTAVVFTIIGIICAITGSVFASVFGGYFTLIMASLLLVIGLKITGILDFDLPVIIKSIPQNNTSSLFIYPFLLGIAFALAGTPCSTPILAGIMVFAAIGRNLPVAVLMLFLFALGQGLILLAAGLFASGLKNLKKFANVTDKIIIVSGYLIILVSFYLYYKVFAPLI